mmetsp:Transcript_8424/g.17470  ORF Transcript_8424/g.17470 Transcript_8424/m.17470 type:complete len:322 (+) Transcript_8424:50-1015(+)
MNPIHEANTTCHQINYLPSITQLYFLVSIYNQTSKTLSAPHFPSSSLKRPPSRIGITTPSFIVSIRATDSSNQTALLLTPLRRTQSQQPMTQCGQSITRQKLRHPILRIIRQRQQRRRTSRSIGHGHQVERIIAEILESMKRRQLLLGKLRLECVFGDGGEEIRGIRQFLPDGSRAREVLEGVQGAFTDFLIGVVGGTRHEDGEEVGGVEDQVRCVVGVTGEVGDDGDAEDVRGEFHGGGYSGQGGGDAVCSGEFGGNVLVFGEVEEHFECAQSRADEDFAILGVGPFECSVLIHFEDAGDGVHQDGVFYYFFPIFLGQER